MSNLDATANADSGNPTAPEKRNKPASKRSSKRANFVGNELRDDERTDFEIAIDRAAGDPDLLDCIKWIQALQEMGTHPTKAAEAWALSRIAGMNSMATGALIRNSLEREHDDQ